VSWDSSVANDWATAWTAEESWFDSRQGKRQVFSSGCRLDLGPRQLSNGYRGLFPPAVKRPVREAKVKNVWSHTSFPSQAFMASRETALLFLFISYKKKCLDEKFVVWTLWLKSHYC
jgi:hypothetical protein